MSVSTLADTDTEREPSTLIIFAYPLPSSISATSRKGISSPFGARTRIFSKLPIEFRSSFGYRTMTLISSSSRCMRWASAP